MSYVLNVIWQLLRLINMPIWGVPETARSQEVRSCLQHRGLGGLLRLRQFSG